MTNELLPLNSSLFLRSYCLESAVFEGERILGSPRIILQKLQFDDPSMNMNDEHVSDILIKSTGSAKSPPGILFKYFLYLSATSCGINFLGNLK